LTKENDWREIDAILDQALDLEHDARSDFLSRRCPDSVLRARIDRLIDAAENEDAFLEAGGALAGPLGRDLMETLEDDATESAGASPEEIQGYRFERRVGAGGMGEVWEAEQLEPVRRRVAVKVIRPGMDSSHVVARFESERQTLALMGHPGIAQVFDAGMTASGRPYFAMEYVDGLPLNEYCDDRSMTLRARLVLFCEICDAVQHAHQKGVIHRDLKPSNVLVAEVDGRPAAKIIDFGIARVVEGPLGGGTLLTEEGQVVGTPEYMSPEQAGVNPGDVDTRADVYALGVLLYELLTGSRPLERSGSGQAALAEFFRQVREEEPPRPSLRVSTLAAKAGEAARARALEPAGLGRALRGDLDWVVMMALEKQRRARYDSVGDLAADVRRHLRNEPVLAGRPSTIYRAVKFARRHRGLLVAASAVLLALIVGLAGTAVGLVRARHEAERARTQAAIAQAVNDFLNDDLLAAVAPGAQGRDVTMQEALDVAAGNLEGRFGGQPEVEAAVRLTIGDTYMQLGRLDDAGSHIARAAALLEEFAGAEDPSTLNALHALGELRYYQGQPEEAQALLLRTFEGRRRVLGENHALTLSAQSDLGAVAHDRGRLDDAERYYRGALDRSRAVAGDDDPQTLTMLHNLAALMRDRVQLDEAEAILREAYDASRRVLGAEHPETLATISMLGSVLREAGRLAEAEPIYVETYEARRRVLGDEHPSTLLSGNNLAMLRMDLGQLEEAASLQRSVLEVQRRVLGDDHDACVLSLGNLGSILTELGRLDEAETIFAEAVERGRRILGPEHPLLGNTLRKQGVCFIATGRYPEAEAALLEARRIVFEALGEDHPDVLQADRALASLPAQ
jgi:serine/threonine protein kinase